MAFNIQHTFSELPLPIIANALSQLDSVDDLYRATLSHRVFRDAFKDNFHTVARQIIRNQIPDSVLPYAFALLKSSRLREVDDKAVQQLLDRLESHVANSDALEQDLISLSISEYAFLCRKYDAVEVLCRSFVEDTVPRLSTLMDTKRELMPTQTESFRLARAFLRYQVMCNLFCTPNTGLPLEDQSSSRFFRLFSPWTNEQLMCVYCFLERKVCFAFEYLAAHDVEWGEMPIDWGDSPEESGRIQWLLTRGLSFLAAIVKADSYKKKAELISLDDWMPLLDEAYPSCLRYLGGVYEEAIDDLSVDNYDMVLASYTIDQLSRLRGVLDGAQDSLETAPFTIWREANIQSPLDKTWFESEDWNLWVCGYVLWDWPGVKPHDLRIKCQRARDADFETDRLRDDWKPLDIERSEQQRTEIYMAGGRGYWPQYGIDFSRIDGLSEEVQERLRKKWDR